MKKFSLKPQDFNALIFTGVFTDIDSAANEAHAGSGSSFTEVASVTTNEQGTTTGPAILSFTDTTGQPQTASEGDALLETFAVDGTTFTGWTLVPAATVATTWLAQD